MLPPSCQSINLWNTKKVKINERCVQKVCRYIRWMKRVSKRSEDRVALPCSTTGVLSFMGFIHLRQIGDICPSVQPTALEKPNSTYTPKWKCRIQQQQQTRSRTWGRFSFRSQTISNWCEKKNHIKIHISRTNTLCKRNWLHRFQYA